MKRIILLLSLLCPLLAAAAPVEESACRKIAAEFLNAKKVRVESSQLKLVNHEFAVKSSIKAPAYYIYKAPSRGFVIVSGDDSVEPILGYSTDNNLGEASHSPAFESWMQMWDTIIESNRAHSTKAGSKVAEAWANVNAPARTTAGPEEMLIETALWDQGSPYNIYCPQDDGGISLTGCTATALAIIMYHHKWPDAGVGTIPGYRVGKITIPAIELGEKYDWDNMLMEYRGSVTEEQKKAVATLMYHVGVMIKSDYSSNGTGSHAMYVANSVTKYMKYENTQVFTYAEYYKDGEWVEQIKKSIQNNCPVHYSGYSTEVGHAFVADGYDKQNKIHINFGWSGTDNGYFAFPDFGEFTSGHMAILNLKKDEGGSTGNIVFDSYKSSKGLVVADMTDKYVFEEGKPMDITASSYQNLSAVTFEGELGVGKWNRDGEMVEVLGSEEVSLTGMTDQGAVYLAELEFPGCVINTPIRVGDVLRPMFRLKGEKKWTACAYPRDLRNFCGEIEIADTRTIEEATTIKFDAQNSVVEIKTKDGVDIKLLDAASAEVRTGVTVTDKGIDIDVTKLAKGSYKLKMTKDAENVEMEVEL